MQEEDYDADLKTRTQCHVLGSFLLVKKELAAPYRPFEIYNSGSEHAVAIEALERVRATQGGQPSISAGRAGSVSSGLFDINRATKVVSEQALALAESGKKGTHSCDLIRATTIAMPTESEVHPITSSSSKGVEPNSSDPSDIEDEQITMDDGDDDKKKVESFFNNLYGMDELARQQQKRKKPVAARLYNLDVDVSISSRAQKFVESVLCSGIKKTH